MILTNDRNDSHLDLITLLVNFSCLLELIVIQVKWFLLIKTTHFVWPYKAGSLVRQVYYNDKLFWNISRPSYKPGGLLLHFWLTFM